MGTEIAVRRADRSSAGRSGAPRDRRAAARGGARSGPALAGLDPHRLLELQRTAGNAAVSSLLAPVVQRTPSVEDADVDQEQTVLTSHFAAQRFLSAAIGATAPTLGDLEPGVAAAVRHWFNIDRDDRSRAFENGRDYVHVQGALRSVQGPSQDASYEVGSLLCDYNPFADGPTAMSLGDIVLCANWFASGADERAGILVHEWTHKWGDGVSRALETYHWHGDWAGMSSAKRVTMPDAYEGFAIEMASGTRITP